MTLTKLVLYIGIIAIALTVSVGIVKKGHKNWLMTFLQNFCGALFIFSGWVKAVDPLGTAFKMEQYFAEFEATFSETWLSFIAPMFPWFSEHAIGFSVTMIIFEIVLGLMLLMGVKSKLTSWAFLLLVAFFTVLTGYTYLTGYVGSGVNFFEFASWGDWVETNMKVTDCGCFGDFLVLEPKVSFLKDVFLMIPALFFVFRHNDMHDLDNGSHRALVAALAIGASLAMIQFGGYSVGLGALIAAIGLIGVQFLGQTGGILGSTVVLLLYCFSNYSWDIPSADFRPFREGVNVRTQKTLEEEAENNIEIIAYKATNKADGKVVEIPYAQYLKEFKKYPKEEWNLEQLKTEPTIPRSKISDFDISNNEGESLTEDILNNPNYSFMIVTYKMKYESEMQEVKVEEKGIVKIDTTIFESGENPVQIDSMKFDTTFKIATKLVKKEVYNFDSGYLNSWTEVVNPVLNAAAGDGITSFAVTAYSNPDLLDAFIAKTDPKYPVYQADDILLKTIVRSNPGIVLMKDGAVVKKWHYKKLPSWEEIKGEFVK